MTLERLAVDGKRIPSIGQGTWFMGERPQEQADEIRALQQGLDLGMTLIDTAEMYADGGAERVVGRAIAGRRDEVFLVSKVYPHRAGRRSAIQACEESLRRLATDHLDLYLLHWPGSIPLAETLEAFERLRAQGKIRRWGVSNFDTPLLRELWKLTGGAQCAANQVLYHLASRGIEFELLPWQREHGVPTMAYCPLAQGGAGAQSLLGNATLADVARGRGVTPAQVALAWCVREGDVIAIPKAVDPAHVKENAAAADLRLTADELAKLDQAFAPPRRKMPLDIV